MGEKLVKLNSKISKAKIVKLPLFCSIILQWILARDKLNQTPLQIYTRSAREDWVPDRLVLADLLGRPLSPRPPRLDGLLYRLLLQWHGVQSVCWLCWDEQRTGIIISLSFQMNRFYYYTFISQMKCSFLKTMSQPRWDGILRGEICVVALQHGK